MSAPHLDVWVTSTGRACVLDCVREFVRQCDYPNWRMLIFESQPDNENGTVEAFKALDCEKAIWTGNYPPLGWIYNTFMDETARFFLRLDDDCWPVCKTNEMFTEAIDLLVAQPGDKPISHVALECNPRFAFDVKANKPPPDAPEIGMFEAYWTGSQFGPLIIVKHPGSLPIVDKRYVMPWNETCHWRQVELYHIYDTERRGLVSAYMLKWWGIMGHFSSFGIDGVSRESNLRRYESYRDLGYFGRRPEETWTFCCDDMHGGVLPPAATLLGKPNA